MCVHIRQRNGQAERLHPTGQTRRQRTAIKTLQTLFGKLRQRGGQRRLIKPAADLRWFAVNQPGFCEAGQVFQFVEFTGGGSGLRGRDRRAIAGLVNGICQQARQRQGVARQRV